MGSLLPTTWQPFEFNTPKVIIIFSQRLESTQKAARVIYHMMNPELASEVIEAFKAPWIP